MLDLVVHTPTLPPPTGRLHFFHTQHFCDSNHKHQLFPCTTLTGFLYLVMEAGLVLNDIHASKVNTQGKGTLNFFTY
jgi:hypothetical protein